MTWIKFALLMLGSYTGYYAAIIFWDYFRSRSGKAANDQQELTFIEDIEPVKSLPEEPNVSGKETSTSFSGGVSLKQLFNLAREESVEYIKSVSY
jgi:hypothetical protein